MWLQLLVKGIPFREELIDLRDKPDWYKEMVPTTLVPAIKLADSGDVIWESKDIMSRVESEFPDAPSLLPATGTAERARAEEMMGECDELGKAGFAVAFAARNASLSEAEKEEKKQDFFAALDELDARIGEGGGPFMLGADFSLVDATYVPMLERWAVQLPLSQGIELRPPPGADAPPRWPRLEAWYRGMEALPSYAERVRGDEYSWAAAVGTFQRMFRANSSEPLSEQAQAVTKRADYAAARALLASTDGASADGGAARAAAAAKLIANRAAIVADATSAEAKSQPQLKRLEAEEAPLVESVLQTAAERLLDAPERVGREMLEEMLDGDWAEAEIAAVRGRAARFVAARLCVPRDLGAEAGAALRATLIEIAIEEERFAWSASGGLL